ncbi:MAG TPA: hypothetical protein VF281_02260 [Candidatus Saccharimonadales bacterium]
MNERHVRKGILNTIAQGGAITNGNVINTLVHKVKAEGISGRDTVLSAIDTLERNDAIRVTRRGKRIVGVYPRPKESHERSERTDRSPEAKREGMYARGVPAYLPDELCSPVVVIKKEERELVTPNDMPAKAKADVSVKDAPEVENTKSSALEDLNLAWTGLRLRADAETGKLPVGSVVDFIVNDLKCSKNRATYLNYTLARLGLRQSVQLGFSPKQEGVPRTSSYQSTVATTVDVITQEMLDALKHSGKSVKDSESEAVPVAQEATVATPEDVPAKLIEIIKELETKNESQERVHQEEVGRLTESLNAAQTQNAALKDQIAALRAPVDDPSVTSVLEKYNKL